VGLLLPSLIVIGITMLGAASPGPDTALILKNSLLGSRATGLATALGIVTGNLLYVAVALLGLGLLITQSGSAFTVAQVLGALYLLYLGFKLIRSKKVTGDMALDPSTAVSVRGAYLEGLITNMLNPKFVLFVLAMFTQVINPEWTIFAKIYLGLLIPLSALVVFSCMVVFLTQPKVRIAFMGIKHIVERVMGVALVALGIKVLVSVK